MQAANENRRLRPAEMSRDDFVRAFGGIYEHSPWVAEAAYDGGIGEFENGIAGLHDALRRAVDEAGRDARLALLNAHPDLAGKLATEDRLTRDSKSEQAGAGLDRCTPEEYAEFRDLNRRYRERFGFPFIVAVRGMDRAGILDAFRSRLGNDPETEFDTALMQVHKIAWLRLETMFTGTDGQGGTP